MSSGGAEVVEMGGVSNSGEEMESDSSMQVDLGTAAERREVSFHRDVYLILQLGKGSKKKKSGIFQIRSDPPTHPQKSPKSGKKK